MNHEDVVFADVSLPPAVIGPGAIVEVMDTQCCGIVLQHSPAYAKRRVQSSYLALLANMYHNESEEVPEWMYYVHIMNNEKSTGWYTVHHLRVIHNEMGVESAIKHIREMPQVDPMLHNLALVIEIDENGFETLVLMELPADDPDRKRFEEAWNKNKLLQYHSKGTAEVS